MNLELSMQLSPPLVFAGCLLFALGCGNPPPKNSAPNGTANGMTNAGTSGSMCEEAIDAYETAYDELDRSCTTADDCTWFGNLASCGCPGFGNADADPQRVHDAQAELQSECEGSQDALVGHRDAVCLNSMICTYRAEGEQSDGRAHTLVCRDETCVAIDPAIVDVTIEPSTITVDETGTTDEFFTVTIETRDIFAIVNDASRIWLDTGNQTRDATPESTSIEDGVVTMTVPFTWAGQLEPGDYTIGAEVVGAEAIVTDPEITTLTVTM